MSDWMETKESDEWMQSKVKDFIYLPWAGFCYL